MKHNSFFLFSSTLNNEILIFFFFNHLGSLGRDFDEKGGDTEI